MEDRQQTHYPAQDDESRGGIGRLLEQKRKERGLSLEEVEQATKIRKRYLKGLEREDYAILPDAVYARGFLKTYANFLGLDGQALSQQLKNNTKTHRERGIDHNPSPEGDFEEPLVSSSGLRGVQKRTISTSAMVTLIVAVLALTAVIGTLYFVGRGVQVSNEDNPPNQEQQNAAGREKAPEAGSANEGAVESKGTADDTEKPADTKQSAPPDKLRVLVNVRERPSWILIRTDGTAAYKQVAQPGFSQTFEARNRVFIKSGDAGAVTVEINGQDEGALGGAGEIVARRYTLKTAS
jgi:cytoskeletal protein RodZ